MTLSDNVTELNVVVKRFVSLMTDLIESLWFEISRPNGAHGRDVAITRQTPK